MLVLLAAALVPLVIGMLDVVVQRTTTLKRLEQPSSVTYWDDSRHYLGLKEGRSLILGRVVEHTIYVGRDPGMSYGHFVDVGIPAGGRPELKDAVWDRAGVRARFATGHELFVPARAFTHGR